MQAFAALLDRLLLTPQRNGKLRLMVDYFRATPDPDRGYALAALTGELNIPAVKPAMLRALVTNRVDEVLFYHSWDYVGDMAETISLIWPERRAELVEPGPAASARGIDDHAGELPPPRPGGERAFSLGEAKPSLEKKGEGAQPEPEAAAPSLSDVVERLMRASKTAAPRLVEELLDHLDAYGALCADQAGHRRAPDRRIRPPRQAGACRPRRQAGERDRGGLARPRCPLRGRSSPGSKAAAPRPESRIVAPFRPVMLSHALADSELALITPEAYAAEWKWDGIRVQAVARRRGWPGSIRAPATISRGPSPTSSRLSISRRAVDGELLVGGGAAKRASSSARSATCSSGSTARSVSAKLMRGHPGLPPRL